MQTDHETKSGGMRMKGVLRENSLHRPLVTVVTAVFNGQPYLEGCLESVLRQDYPNIEHIVMDGGSSDGTLDVLRHYDDRIAFWKSGPDKGVYDAWNKALAEASGEWISFLGADDELLPGAVSAYVALAAMHPEAEYLSSRVRGCMTPAMSASLAALGPGLNFHDGCALLMWAACIGALSTTASARMTPPTAAPLTMSFCYGPAYN